MFKLLVTAGDIAKVDRGFWPVLNTSAQTAKVVGWAKSASSALLVLTEHLGPDDAREVGTGQSREFWPISARAARLLRGRKFFVGRVWEPAAETVAEADAERAADDTA